MCDGGADFNLKQCISTDEQPKYVKDNNLHGIMFWQLMNDKRKDGLLKVMVNNIKENQSN